MNVAFSPRQTFVSQTHKRNIPAMADALDMCNLHALRHLTLRIWSHTQEAVAYHCFRGLLVPETAVLLDTALKPPASASIRS